MLEYHGWIVIAESYNEKDASDELRHSLWLELCKKVAQLQTEVSDIAITMNVINAVYQISIFGCCNHKGYTWQQVYRLLQWIAKSAVGSYGIFYLQDDEDIEAGNTDKFIIYCLKKGQIYQIEDKLLSPLVPEIEDKD